MKPVRNSLIVALGSALPFSLVLLPISKSVVFASASPTPVMDSPAVSTSPSLEATSKSGFTTTPNQSNSVVGKFSTLNLSTIAVPAVAQVSHLGVPTAQKLLPTPNVPTIVVPVKPVSSPAMPTDQQQEPTTTTQSTSNSGQQKQPASTPQGTDKPQTTKKPDTSDSAEQKEPETSPEEIARQKKLLEADQLYLSGRHAAAQKLYQEAKPPFAATKPQTERKEPITDPEQLPPAAQAYWRLSGEGMAQKLETKTFAPLELLVQQYPEFIPGQLRYVQALKDYNRPQEATKVLERAASMYPEQADLVRANVEAKAQDEKWLEASLAARQFALLHANDPAAPEMTALAEKYLARYKQHIRARIRRNTITNIFTGAVGYALTGSLFGPLTAVDSTVMLMRGESAIGASAAKQAKRQLPMLDDPEVLSYVREVGNKLAAVAGRTDFQYEFYVVMDDSLNAFALPGGKVFVNAGAIAKTNSEAELAGLMAHELSHAVLSHGFQLASQGNLTANLTQYLPLGDTIGDLFVLSYSRDMERQADTLGTRILAASGYAADGMRNLMVTLTKEDKDHSEFSWLRDHPATKDRVRYLEELIQTNGYDRYVYEGVARHAQMKEKVKKLLAEYKKRKEKKEHPQHRNRQPIVNFHLGF